MKILVRALAALALSAAAHAALAQDRQQTPAQPQTTQTPQTTPAAQAGVPALTTDAGKAVVFVYRPGKLLGKALEPTVFCDGVELARMDNGRYFVVLLEPGEHRIHMTQDKKRVDLRLNAGDVAFVRMKIEMGMMKGRGEIDRRNNGDAANDLKKLEPLGLDKFKENKLVVADKAQAEALLKKYVP